MDFRKTIAEAREMVRRDLKTLCTEVLEWHSTSLLRKDGRFRQIAELVATVEPHHAYPMVESMVKEEAMKFVVSEAK